LIVQDPEKEQTMRLTGLLRLLLPVVAVTLMGSVLAAQGGVAQDDLSRLMPRFQTVTFKLTRSTWPTALRVLGESAGIQIRLTPDVEVLSTPTSFDFTNARFDAVFRVFLAAGHLTYAVIDEKTVVVTGTP
jgi:hypothetical protein